MVITLADLQEHYYAPDKLIGSELTLYLQIRSGAGPIEISQASSHHRDAIVAANTNITRLKGLVTPIG